MSILPRLLLRGLPLVWLATLGCGDEPSEPVLTPVSIPFAARVGSEPFACGRTYQGLGTTGTTYEPMEFRVYVHDVRLVSEAGQEVPVTLADDGVWQREGAALLDFADKSGLCTNGTQATRALLTGTVPEGRYTGLRFKLGLPASLNHRDASVAPAPFNDLSLYWNWLGGYIFARIEGRTTGLREGHYMHLGSTECAAPPPGQPNGTSGCANGNRPEIDLAAFDVGQDTVVMDVAALLAGSNLDVNAAVPNTSVGCMSQQQDPDCADVFSRLGLAHQAQSQAPAGQVFIRAE
ncbi:metallo-mystery pair system four-Cys motif protein [Myxococcus sp. AM011]|uniref:MbnP family copper-binding protein n=1 Tax=Myxococcus sp. AM011 TaxID=2745200 RepID=UPI0015962BA1|nr:MbnP family copper-binding protein [Myxococcus sp. AM011]NVJ25205.1 metallo-mystery pair system four-Cys motif protein [Myxococcus sp. AM011]